MLIKNLPQSSLFLESYFALVLDYFVLTDPRVADQVCSEYLTLPQSGVVLC